MSRRWKQAEINYLKRFAAAKSLEELAQRFDVGADAVRAKLAELGLASKDGADGEGTTDPLIAGFEAGVQALFAGELDRAEEHLAAVAGQSDLLELAGRARQYLAICRNRRGEVKEVPDAEPFAVAVYHKNRGAYAQALELCDAADGDERFLYLAASIHAAEGRLDEAAAALAKAVEQHPDNRVHAFHDPDFAELRKQPEHAHLFGLD